MRSYLLLHAGFSPSFKHILNIRILFRGGLQLSGARRNEDVSVL